MPTTTRDEDKARAADEAAQERGTATPDTPRRPTVAAAYVHAVHPDHGEPVVFVPGETLPDWAAQQVARTSRQPDADGVLDLGSATRRKR